MTDSQAGNSNTDTGSKSLTWGLDVTVLRESSWLTIITVVVAGAAAVTGFNLSRTTIVNGLQPIYDVTNGLVQTTLLVNLLLLVVIVGGVILGLGQLRPRDIGLVREDLWIGLGITAGTWILMQSTGVVAVLVQGRSLGFDESWATIGATAVFGGFLAQILGNALYEEIVYRAFLLPQLTQKFRHRMIKQSPRTVFVFALLVSQSVFGIIHIPSRLAQGATVGDLPLLLLGPFLIGVLFALVYYRTGNLFVTVGLHALVNDPVLVVNAGAIALFPILFVLLAVLLVWPSISALFRTDQQRTAVNRKI